VLDDRRLGPVVTEAASLLATVVGQDLEAGDDGSFRIARRVAKDRVISTVDPDARHGHKTAARGFDGYKGHVAIDPETELITATRVTAGNAGDAGVAAELIADVMTATEAAEAAVVYGDSAYGTGTFQIDWRRPGSPRGARPSRRYPARGGLPRTGSPSIWRTSRSPARPASPL